jgi:outer membrane protein assembly factor BamD
MRFFIYSFIIIFSLSGCSYQKLLKKGTPEEKLRVAKKYYTKKDYARAQPLFEALITAYYGRGEAEEIYYYYGQCHFGGEEYLLAGYYFRDFVQKFPNSDKLEEVSFLVALCDYKKSLRSELDQTNTRMALGSLQLFIDQNPNSQYVAEANKKIDDLRARLLDKVYRNAKIFYMISEYKAAMVACENAIENYPDMMHTSELAYYVVDAAFKLAKNSLVSVQEDRYKTVLEKAAIFYKENNEQNNVYLKSVQEIEKKTRKELEKITLNIQ